MPTWRDLQPGDPAPWFVGRTTPNPRYRFDTAAGRPLLLCFFGSSSDGHAEAALAAVRARPDLFDDVQAAFFGISMDAADEAGRLQNRIPGYRFFWDQDGTVGKLYGAVAREFAPGQGPAPMARRWVLLDRALRVISVIPFATDRSDIATALRQTEQASRIASDPLAEPPAPVLVLPRVFEADFCAQLVQLCRERELVDSGFMVEEGGLTVARHDHRRKRRQDCDIEDAALKEQIRQRIVRRIVPEMARAFQFAATRVERYLIGRYGAEDGGFFHAHRDNTTKGTAHRRFAVTIGLTDDYEGGLLRFPEFGNRGYRPARGEAIVFSCSLLHLVEPVTAGERFVFLPFLYDEPAARIREENLRFVAEGKAQSSA